MPPQPSRFFLSFLVLRTRDPSGFFVSAISSSPLSPLSFPILMFLTSASRERKPKPISCRRHPLLLLVFFLLPNPRELIILFHFLIEILIRISNPMASTRTTVRKDALINFNRLERCRSRLAERREINHHRRQTTMAEKKTCRRRRTYPSAMVDES
ncbi:unnamed protein product [Linum tenue]|uniref:Uncharacterized protein n=1 Tax=Linum tenue TaxID=586396 RepID=A0AAV0KRH1_9ROSI|nr:unnamed protein product [Linum tenue]